MKLFDKLFINGLVIALLSLLFYFVTKVFIAGIFIGYLVWVVCRALFLFLSSRFHLNKNLSAKEMENVFAVWGTQKQAEYFLRLLPALYSPVLIGNAIRLFKNGVPVVLIFNYKFSPTSCEDVAKIYREKKSDEEKFICLGKTPSKDVLILGNTLSLSIEFPSSQKVRNFLIKHNAMPTGFPMRKTKRSLKLAFSNTFSAEKAKYYFLSAVFCAFYALFNIQRVWYISFCVLLIVSGVCCVLSYLLQKKNNK